MSAEIDGGPEAFTKNASLRWARLFKIEPVLAVPVYLTSHATSLLFEGNTYDPAYAIEASAQTEATGGKDYDISFKGALTSDNLTQADLSGGVYRGATITEYVVDWRFPMAGAVRTYKYIIEDLEWDGESYDAKCSGLLQPLTTKKGNFFSRQCVVDLESPFCGVDLETIPNGVFENLEVSEIVSERVFKIPPSQVPTNLGDDWFRWGKIQWTYGLNRFRLATIIKYDESEGEFTIAERPTYPILLDNSSVGGVGPDKFTVRAGCNKTQSTCAGKFNNFDSFQGNPYVRGSDLYAPGRG